MEEKMYTAYEIHSGRLHPIVFDDPAVFTLEDISHLIIDPVSDDYLCITNSFRNKSLLMRKEDWKGPGAYPASFETFVGFPLKPIQEIDLPDPYVQLCQNTVSFIIVLSYDCNLRCPYCYQQCNEALDRSMISADKLNSIFDTIERYHRRHPEKYIDIGLFGGEPLLPENHENILKIFDFCVKNRFSVSLTTNGVGLPYYLTDLIIYSGLNIKVGTTVDSIAENETTRFSQNAESDSGSNSILMSVNTLINNGVRVHVEMNIDKHNIDEMENMFAFYQKNGFLDNPNFALGIGLIDDRRYEIGYSDTISDSELIARLMSMDSLHKRIYYAFVKAPLNLCRKVFPDFRQSERKYVNNYCWASAPLDNVYYIDPDLDVFRCTYSVGRKEYALFKFSLEELERYKLPNRTYMDYPSCRNCNIGGYCAGGCALSADVDFERMCADEKADFRDFLHNVYYPKVQELLSAKLLASQM